ncbi:MAG: Uma2 family endonuclease [Acidobacteria bacterium]|nr:Uma2 family endonuclease [Acidobacteriota bacterium]
MSQPAIALAPLPFELVYDDGEPLETEWHTLQYPILRRLFREVMTEAGRTDFYTGGNMFVYFSVEQAREVSEEMTKGLPWRAFRGPDVFWVGGVDPDRERKVWIAWEEGGRLPDVIVELLSPSTAKKDRTEKRDLYARVFRTAEYFLCDPETWELEGLRLADRFYRPIPPDEQGRLWSEQLGVSFGLWYGALEGRTGEWVRLFRPDGSLVPTPEERAEVERQRAEAEHQRAETEHQRAEAERQRAEAAEAEVARLRAALAERGL